MLLNLHVGVIEPVLLH